MSDCICCGCGPVTVIATPACSPATAAADTVGTLAADATDEMRRKNGVGAAVAMGTVSLVVDDVVVVADVDDVVDAVGSEAGSVRVAVCIGLFSCAVCRVIVAADVAAAVVVAVVVVLFETVSTFKCKRIISLHALSVAYSIGVRPFLSLIAASAPQASRVSTRATRPLAAAQCNGVVPSSALMVFAFALASNSAFAALLDRVDSCSERISAKTK